MAGELSVLRIEIDGGWTTTEFARLFSELELLNEMASYALNSQDEQQGRSIYDVWSILGTRPSRYSHPWARSYELEVQAEEYVQDLTLRQFMNEYATIPELRVAGVSYNSPGFVDLLGAGKVIGHITKFVLGVTDRFLATEDRALAREEKRQKILKAKIANAESLLKLGSKLHMNIEARRGLVRRALEIDTYLEGQVIDGKITATREIEVEVKGQNPTQTFRST